MSEPRRSDGQARHEARIQCRECAFTLGRLSRDRTHPTITPGVHMLVDVTEARVVHLVCPRCGTRRSMTNLVFAAMAIPRIVEETTKPAAK